MKIFMVARFQAFSHAGGGLRRAFGLVVMVVVAFLKPARCPPYQFAGLFYRLPAQRCRWRRCPDCLHFLHCSPPRSTRAGVPQKPNRRRLCVMSELILKCEARGRCRDGGLDVRVLHGLDLEIRAGESTAIIGSSGSGKSTLLHIRAGWICRLEAQGAVDGRGFAYIASDNWASCATAIRFLYQFHHLLPEFSALENVMMLPSSARKNGKRRQKRSNT